MHPSACPFTSVSHYVCALFPFLLHPPQSRTHSFAFARGGPGLSWLLQTFIHRCYPALFRPLFLLLICCPPHLSVHFSFLLFVPISSAQMRCCVLRRVCTFLITGPVWVLVGRNGPVMKQSTAVQTHTNQIYRCFGVCVGVYVCALVHAHVHPDKWLIKVTLCLISLFLPLSFSLFLSFSFASSYYFSLTIYLCSCLYVSWL